MSGAPEAPAATPPAGDVYVPFLDGVLDHDCAACDGGCCRSSGHVVCAAREAEALVARWPAVEFCSLGRTAGSSAFRMHGACWFLGADGVCEVERRHGYALKPIACRQYPFAVAPCAGTHVVVPLPGSGCGPLRVAPPGRRGSVSVDRVRADQLEAATGGRLEPEIAWPPARLAAERGVLAAAERYLRCADYLEFAVHQEAAARATPEDAARARLAERRALWRAFLGAGEPSAETHAETYDLTALTPLLRVAAPSLRDLEPGLVAEALLLLSVVAGASPGERSPSVYGWLDRVRDLPLGLLRLTGRDLELTSRPLEVRLRYARALERAPASLARTAAPATGAPPGGPARS